MSSTCTSRSNSFIIWLLLLGLTLVRGGESIAVVGTSRDTSVQVVVVGGVGEGTVVHPKIDVNYMSNRRVPKGPDPIHNRRASNSRRPPGKALR